MNGAAAAGPRELVQYISSQLSSDIRRFLFFVFSYYADQGTSLVISHSGLVTSHCCDSSFAFTVRRIVRTVLCTVKLRHCPDKFSTISLGHNVWYRCVYRCLHKVEGIVGLPTPEKNQRPFKIAGSQRSKPPYLPRWTNHGSISQLTEKTLNNFWFSYKIDDNENPSHIGSSAVGADNGVSLSAFRIPDQRVGNYRPVPSAPKHDI